MCISILYIPALIRRPYSISENEVLHHLDKTLSPLPIRNMLLMGGDFKSMGTRDSVAFGPGTCLGKHPHPEHQLLVNTHRLTALNTWSRVSRA